MNFSDATWILSLGWMEPSSLASLRCSWFQATMNYFNDENSKLPYGEASLALFLIEYTVFEREESSNIELLWHAHWHLRSEPAPPLRTRFRPLIQSHSTQLSLNITQKPESAVALSCTCFLSVGVSLIANEALTYLSHFEFLIICRDDVQPLSYPAPFYHPSLSLYTTMPQQQHPH